MDYHQAQIRPLFSPPSRKDTVVDQEQWFVYKYMGHSSVVAFQ